MARKNLKVNRNREKKILDAALQIFAEKGFQETTISEISKAAGVSDATIYEYFKSKEDLLFAIPEAITSEAFDAGKEYLPYFKDAEGKIRAIVCGYMNLYQKNPHYSALVMLQLKSNRNFLRTNAYAVIKKAAGTLLRCLREGIEEGSFRDDIDPYLVRSMILGTIEHLCTRWHLLGSPSDLIKYVDPLLEIIFRGIRKNNKPKEYSIHLHLTEDGLSTHHDRIKEIKIGKITKKKS